MLRSSDLNLPPGALLGPIEAQQILRMLASGDSQAVLSRIASRLGMTPSESNAGAVERQLRECAEDALWIHGGKELWREPANAEVSNDGTPEKDNVEWRLYGRLPTTEEDATIFGRAINAYTFRGRLFQLNYLIGHQRDVAKLNTSREPPDANSIATGSQEVPVEQSAGEDTGMAP